MWEFVRKNTFAALAFTSYGAFWLAFYAIEKFGIPGGGSDTVRIFLLGWTIFTAVHDGCGDQDEQRGLTVFVLLSITFILLTIGTGGRRTLTDMMNTGGWTGTRDGCCCLVRVGGGGHQLHARQSCASGRSTRLT